YDHRQKSSYTVSCETKTRALGMAGNVGGAHVDSKDHWFGAQVPEDGVAVNVVVDFTAIKDFAKRIRNCRASYWVNMTTPAPMNSARMDLISDQIYKVHLESEDAKKGYICKIEFEVVDYKNVERA
ncbi:MAG: hypothetical protein ACIAXF_01915, partial [Phycisphaerales bacterium JB063]